MKTRWEFFFDTIGFKFDREYKYKGEAIPPEGSKEHDGAAIPFVVKFIPDEQDDKQSINQTGRLVVELPLYDDEAKDFAYHVAYLAQQKISFEHGRLKIHSAFIVGKRIPETKEEEAEVGDSPYFATFKFKEVVEAPKFDPKSFSSPKISPDSLRLLSQYNSAKSANNPIDMYLGLFKIIEDQFCGKNRKETIGEALKGSDLFFELYKKTFSVQETKQQDSAVQELFRDFVKKLVHIRHNCSHLKSKRNFGYSYDDSRVDTEVKPTLIAVDNLVRILINNF